MGKRNHGILLSVLFLLAERAQAAIAPSGYWIWAGIPPGQVSEPGKTIYLFQGHVLLRDGRTFFAKQGLSPFPAGFRDLFLVFRLSALDANEPLREMLLFAIQSWEMRGNEVAGIQFDFDSATAKLPQYAEFLKRVRAWLPKKYRLSVTGLGDWVRSSPVSPDRLFLESTDEIVFQLYRGRKSVSDREYYLGKLKDLRRPFKVGLLSSTPLSPEEEASLKSSSHFRGTVIFLQRE